MLEDLFKDANEYYHAKFTLEKGLYITENCPPDRFEEARELDRECFLESGEHLFSNFEESDKNKRL